MLVTAVQASCLKAAANLTTQLATGWYSDAAPESLDKQRVLEFAAYGFIGAVINYEFQHFLERKFPTRTHASKRPSKASPGSLEKGGSGDTGGGPEKMPAVAKGSSGELTIARNGHTALLLSTTIVACTISINASRIKNTNNTIRCLPQSKDLLDTTRTCSRRHPSKFR